MSHVTCIAAASSACLSAETMIVPAFLAHTTVPKVPCRVVPTFWRQHTNDAIARHGVNANSLPARRRVCSLSLRDDGVGEAEKDDAGVGVGWVEPTLEETFDAIDDVMMDRLPGEGEQAFRCSR